MVATWKKAAELGSGRDMLHLRLTEARNSQRRGIRFAEDYTSPEPRQLRVHAE
jgi:hypothetical protein